MTAYLLVPNRGPADYNLDSLFLVAEKSSKPQPFVRRLQEWIYNGIFDGVSYITRGEEYSNLQTRVLYRYLNKLRDMPSKHPLQALRSVICDRTLNLLQHQPDIPIGLYHLYWMRSEQFIDIDSIFDRVYELPRHANEEHEKFFDLLRSSDGGVGELRAFAQRLRLIR
jgi:hypothetical protein